MYFHIYIFSVNIWLRWQTTNGDLWSTLQLMRNAQNKRDSSNTNTGIREWSSSGLLVVHQLIRPPRGYYNCYIELFQLFHIREKSLPEPPVKSGNLGKLLNKLIFPPPKLIIERWPYFCWHHHYKNCLLRGDGEFFSQKISLTSKSFFVEIQILPISPA